MLLHGPMWHDDSRGNAYYRRNASLPLITSCNILSANFPAFQRRYRWCAIIQNTSPPTRTRIIKPMSSIDPHQRERKANTSLSVVIIYVALFSCPLKLSVIGSLGAPPASSWPVVSSGSASAPQLGCAVRPWQSRAASLFPPWLVPSGPPPIPSDRSTRHGTGVETLSTVPDHD